MVISWGQFYADFNILASIFWLSWTKNHYGFELNLSGRSIKMDNSGINFNKTEKFREVISGTSHFPKISGSDKWH